MLTKPRRICVEAEALCLIPFRKEMLDQSPAIKTLSGASMVCSKREEADTAISSNNLLREEVNPNNFDKLERCKLSVMEGAVKLTFPVCEFCACRALSASEMGLPGKDREY